MPAAVRVGAPHKAAPPQSNAIVTGGVHWAVSLFALLWGALAGSCNIDPTINPVYGCNARCAMCIEGFCYDPPDEPADAAMPDAMVDAATPDASMCDGAMPDAACGCAEGCPEGEQCCRGMCAAECPSVCGNNELDQGEACDGGPLCSPTCTLLFHPALVHRYPFNGKGTDAIDVVGAANGKLVNAELKGTGDLELAGGMTDQFVNLPNALTRALSSITVEMWITWRGGTAGQRLFDFGNNSAGEDKNTGNGTSYLYATPQDTNGNLAAHINFSYPSDAAMDTVVQAGNALSSGIRHQVAVVFDGEADAFLLYLDGVNLATVNGITGMLAQIDDRNVWIGRGNAPVESFKGTVHEFRIYDAALNGDAIRESFDAGSDPGGAPMSK